MTHLLANDHRGKGRTHLLGQEGHRERLVEQSQLALLALPVVRIAKNAAVQQRSVDIGHHGANVPRAVRRLGRRRVLDGVKIVDDRRIKVHRVALVERVDLAPMWDLDLPSGSLDTRCARSTRSAGSAYVRVGEDEFSQGSIERVSVDSEPCGQDEVRGRSVPHRSCTR